jgi:ATP phosphoribosyltransferase regulatory subunit
VLHTRPDKPHATREPLQFGAEIYGHAGLEADLEILLLALDCLRAARVQAPSVDMADARIVRALLVARRSDGGCRCGCTARWPPRMAELKPAHPRFSAARAKACWPRVAVWRCRGSGPGARGACPSCPALMHRLSSLKWLASHLDGTGVTFDLADLRGYAYYSGAMFSMYAPGGQRCAGPRWPV